MAKKQSSGPSASTQTEEVNRLPETIDGLVILESAEARARMRANPLLSYLRTRYVSCFLWWWKAPADVHDELHATLHDRT